MYKKWGAAGTRYPYPVISFCGPLSLQQKNSAQFSPVSSLLSSDVGLGIFLRKMAVRHFFSKFNVNLLELSRSDFLETFRHCRGEKSCTDRLRLVALRDPTFVLWGLKVATFFKNSKSNNSKPEVEIHFLPTAFFTVPHGTKSAAYSVRTTALQVGDFAKVPRPQKF